MVWFQVDDGMYDHPKVKAIPRRARGSAIGLWAMAGSWNARYHHDGLVPLTQIEELGFTARDAEHLTAVTLWHAHGYVCPSGEHCTPAPPGFVTFHEWAKNGQQTKDHVEAKRAKARERQARLRARKNQLDSEHPADQEGPTK